MPPNQTPVIWSDLTNSKSVIGNKLAHLLTNKLAWASAVVIVILSVLTILFILPYKHKPQPGAVTDKTSSTNQTTTATNKSSTPTKTDSTTPKTTSVAPPATSTNSGGATGGATGGSSGGTSVGSGGSSGGSTGYPAFPTAASTGVSSGVSLTNWPGSSYRTDQVSPTSTQVIDGITWSVYENYNIVLPAGQYLYIPTGNILLKNSKITGSAAPSNTGALVQGNGATWIWLDHVEVQANGYARGIQSDNAHLKVTNSKFIDTSNAAIEKNDPSSTKDLIISGNYIQVGCSWTTHDPGAHADGIQWGDARNVTVYNNTILVNFIYSSCISNSTIGGWAEAGDVNTATIEHNLLAGGGASVYLEQKNGYSWLGEVKFINNVLDTRYNPAGGYWCALAPNGLPSQLTWTGNTWSNGNALSLAAAKSGC